MQVTRNPKREQIVLDQIRASFAKDGPREGVHLSDTLSPRRSFWQRVMPLPPTNAECLYWLAGRGHEDALGRVAGLVITEQKFWKESGEEDCVEISYRPDFTFNDLFPGEFKTRRSNLAKEGEEALTYESYLEQLRGYAAIEDSNYAMLLVLSLLEGRKSGDPLKPSEPTLAVYDVHFTDEELAVARQHLMERKAPFVQALVAWSMELFFASLGGRPPGQPEGHRQLPLCKDWMCGKQRKVMVTGPRCETCDKEFETEYGSSRHKHPITPPVVRWEYEPRCKWYEHCRPQDVDSSRGAR